MRQPCLAPLIVALAVSIPAAAHSQTGVEARATAAGAAPASATSRMATDARRAPEKWIEAILARGAEAPAGRLSKLDSRLKREAIAVNKEADGIGVPVVATRLAAEFNTTAEELIREEARHACGWGDLTIARTLAANSSNPTPVELLYRMRQDRNGWAQIAAGMGFLLDDVLRAVKTEARVARGRTQADGKVAAVRGVGSIHGAGPEGKSAQARDGTTPSQPASAQASVPADEPGKP